MLKDLTASTRLLSHLQKFRDDAWDISVLQRTKICLLDSLACFCGGLLMSHFKQSAAGFRHSLFSAGSELIPSPFFRAYLYGQAVIAMDYDDALYGHPGSPIISAVLAIAGENKLTLDRALRGIAAGYETHGILCAAAEPSSEHGAKVRSVGNLDTIAAAIGISIALDFNDDMIVRVIGVAVAHSILPYTAKWYERPVPGMKNNVGWIAAGAVLAVNLAQEGQTGVTNPLEGDKGLWRMVGSDRWAFNDEVFNNKPAVLRTGFKHYPACWHTQEYLKTFAALLGKVDAGDDVVEIVVFATPDIEKFCNRDLVGTADIAFNLPAMFERLIAGIEPGPLWESCEPRESERGFQYVRSNDRRIVVKTHQGQELTAPVELNSMSDAAKSGLDDEGVLAKFNRLADDGLQHAALPLLHQGGSESVGLAIDRLGAVCAIITKLMMQ